MCRVRGSISKGPLLCSPSLVYRYPSERAGEFLCVDTISFSLPRSASWVLAGVTGKGCVYRVCCVKVFIFVPLPVGENSFPFVRREPISSLNTHPVFPRCRACSLVAVRLLMLLRTVVYLRGLSQGPPDLCLCYFRVLEPCLPRSCGVASRPRRRLSIATVARRVVPGGAQGAASAATALAILYSFSGILAPPSTLPSSLIRGRPAGVPAFCLVSAPWALFGASTAVCRQHPRVCLLLPPYTGPRPRSL